MNSSYRDRHTAELHQMQRAIAGLYLYQDLFDCEIGTTLIDLLKAIGSGDRSQADALICLTAYGRFFKALATENCSWEEFIINGILRAENPFSLQAQKTEFDRLSPALVSAVRQDLQALDKIYQCGQYIPHWVKQVGNLNEQSIAWIESSHLDRKLAIVNAFQTTDWGELAGDMAKYYQLFGVGVFGKHSALKWQNELIGIIHPDRVQIENLVGYDEQKATLIENTQSLLSGNPALNILLYGGKGTGKSSLVKGLLNHYADTQLRLVEVSKSAMIDLPLILDRLTDLPQKFIIFIDDLSFEADDEAFKALKVVLEGSITAKPDNVVVYATSNRRHLVREYFGDRPRPQDADDIHMWDTTQEKLSFSDRFGITLTFEPADQAKYLEIVHHLASSAKLPNSLPSATATDRSELEAHALQWATRHNGRSGRTARQFIDYLCGKSS